MSVHPAKTQISLGIRPVWSESSLSAWRKLGSLATNWAHSEDWSDWADAQADLSLRCAHTHFVGFVMSWLIFGNRSGQTVLEAAPVAECLRTLIFSALNRLSSHRCGFEPSSDHTWDKSSSACGWPGGFSRGSPVFAPPNDMTRLKMSEIILTGRKTQIKNKQFRPRWNCSYKRSSPIRVTTLQFVVHLLDTLLHRFTTTLFKFLYIITIFSWCPNFSDFYPNSAFITQGACYHLWILNFVNFDWQIIVFFVV